MYSKSNIIALMLSILVFVGCHSEKSNVLNTYGSYKVSEDVCKYYSIKGEEITYVSNYVGGTGKRCISLDSNLYGLISPFQHSDRKEVLLVNRDHDIFRYNLVNSEFTEIKITPDFDNVYYYYFNNKLILIDTLNRLHVFRYEKERFLKESELRIADTSIFNIYGGINSKSVLIESGYFPSGGCEYIKYHSLDLNDYTYKDVTHKILPINNLESPFDVYYMDITQEYYFFPYEKMVRFRQTQFDDYILDSNFDTVGRALRKKNTYIIGYNLNPKDEIEYYFFEISDRKYLCFPVNINFEKQIYNTYYDSLLIKQDLGKLEKTEIELLKNTILLKNNGAIKNEKIRDVLSVYAFYHDFEGVLPKREVLTSLKGNEKLNYELLQSLD